MSPAEILDRAADEMQRRGKANGIRMNGSGQVCALGALQVANGVIPSGLNICNGLPMEAANALGRFVSPGGNWYCVAPWSNSNDAPTVIAGMRAVAATLRAQADTTPVVETVAA